MGKVSGEKHLNSLEFRQMNTTENTLMIKSADMENSSGVVVTCIKDNIKMTKEMGMEK